MADLEKDIGELKGILKPLARTAERISDRVDENRDMITDATKDLELHKKEVWRAVRTLEKGAEENKKEDDAAHRKLEDIERDVQVLTARSKGAGKFLLRVLEMVIAATVGGIVVKLFGG